MKPTFIFICGAWHPADYWGPLVRALADAGYDSVAVEPRCVDSNPAATFFQPDADAVKDAIEPLLENGRDVIVVMHSYGGVVGTDAVGDIVTSKPELAAGIKRLVYIAAYVPVEGLSLAQLALGAPGPAPGVYCAPDNEGYMVLNDGADEAFYHDVAEPDRSKYYARLGKHPMGSFFVPASHLGWTHVPSSYIYTTLDRPLPLNIQEFMVKRIQDMTVTSGKSSIKPFSGPLGTFFFHSGHSPMLSMTSELAAILHRIAE